MILFWQRLTLDKKQFKTTRETNWAVVPGRVIYMNVISVLFLWRCRGPFFDFSIMEPAEFVFQTLSKVTAVPSCCCLAKIMFTACLYQPSLNNADPLQTAQHLCEGWHYFWSQTPIRQVELEMVHIILGEQRESVVPGIIFDMWRLMRVTFLVWYEHDTLTLARWPADLTRCTHIHMHSYTHYTTAPTQNTWRA